MEKNAKISFTIDAEIQALQNKLKAAKKEAEWLTSSDYGKGLEKTFTKIENSLTRLQQKAASPVMSDRMFDGLQNELNSVGISVKNLVGTVDSLGELSRRQKIELLPAGERDKFLDALKAIDNFIDKEAQFKTESQQLTKARRDLADAQDNLTEAIGKQADKQALLNKAQQKETNAKAVLDAAQARVDALEDQEQAAKELSDELQRVAELYEKFGGDKRKKADFTTPEGETVNYQAAKKAAKEASENLPTQEVKQAAQLDLDKAQQEYKEASKEVTNFTRQVTSADTRVKTLQQSIVRLTDSVSTLEAEWATSSEKDRADAFRELRKEAEQLGLSLDDIGDDASTENIDKLKTSLNNFVDDGVSKVNTGLDESKKEFNSINPVLETAKDEVEDGREAWRGYNEQVSNTNAMVSRIKQFVGMEGAITAMRAAVRNAMQSIKELDATMTEMSVVTDLGVEDYWNQLPEHTQRANQLGIAINDIYKAETLYYQQGLKTNEVTEMSAETLKMARVAGLSAEDATNKMTAALRGFNMELNETSAQRISDVYSELAAITASDVDEISSAMTKTASIASSAGMEFETTAAFLSQIIETTRESAETAGTALKTVVARFQELKKDPAEIGEVEGEVVDANKIEAALRSVNVALRDTSGQFRDLDDVFLELASKWDTLDTNTQRYIATIAAGSR